MSSLRHFDTDISGTEMRTQISESVGSDPFEERFPRISHNTKATRDRRLTGAWPTAETYAGRPGDFDKNLKHSGIGVLRLVDNHDQLTASHLIEHIWLFQ